MNWMKNSYFLLTILPPLDFGKRPFISWEELVTLVENNSSASDLQQLRQFQMLKDIENCQKIFLNLPLAPGGALDQTALLEAIEERSYFPKFVLSFFDAHVTSKERLHHFPELMRSVYTTFGMKSGFIGSYINFEEKAKMVLGFLRARLLQSNQEKMADPVLPLLQSDEDDLFFQQIVNKKQALEELPSPFDQLKEIFDAKHKFPYELEYSLTQWRYKAYEELASSSLFSFDQVLLYLTQWQLLTQLSSYDLPSGLKKFETIIEAS